MLVESVVTSKSIAAVATEDASNKIPFLGLGFFPAEAQEGIELKWIKTHKGLSPILAPSNFDALPVIRGREGIKIEKTEMPFFRESMLITERDINVFDIDNLKINSNFKTPCCYSEGFDYVIVNGEIVVKDGKHTGKRPGMVLRRSKNA